MRLDRIWGKRESQTSGYARRGVGLPEQEGRTPLFPFPALLTQHLRRRILFPVYIRSFPDFLEWIA